MALVVGLPVVVLLAERQRGKAILAATLAELEAQGETLDLARLFPRPEAAAERAAADLLAVAQSLPSDNPAPPSVRRIAPGVAVAGTRLEWWEGNRSTNTWEDAAAWLKTHAEDLQRLHRVLRAPARQPRLQVEAGLMQMPFSHLAPAKRAVQSLGLAAAQEARRGAIDPAITHLQAMRQIDTDLAPEPLLISQLVRIACATITANHVWSALPAQAWDDADLARLQEGLRPASFIPGMVRSLEGERALALQEFRRADSASLALLVSGDQWGLLLANLGGSQLNLEMPTSVDEASELVQQIFEHAGKSIRLRLVFPVWRFAWGDQAIARYLQAVQAELAACREAARQGSWKVGAAFDRASWNEPPRWHDRLCNAYVRMGTPAIENAVAKAFVTENQFALHDTALALTRHRLRHGAFPDSLDALVPTFLPELPRDRMDGQPLRYRKEADDRFTLWSIGDDLRDDGGDGTKEGASTETFAWWLARDAVWPRAASPEQTAEHQRAEARRLAGKRGTGEFDPTLLKRYGLTPKTTPSTPPTNPPPAPR